MTAQAVVEVFVGTKGWRFSNWLDGFYPDDLPQDWQFGYYCNEFRTVLIPQQTLLSADREELADWFASTSDQFAFCIEIDQDVDIHCLFDKVNGYLNKIACFVLRMHPISPSGIERCQPTLRALADIAPISLLPSDKSSVNYLDSDPLLKALADQALNLSWWANSEKPPVWGNTTTGVLMVDADSTYRPIDLRSIVERVLQYAKLTQRVIIIFDGQQPKVNDLRTVKTLCELLL